MISSLSFFAGLLPFRESVGPGAIFDSGVTSTLANSSIEGSPLSVFGSERLERFRIPLEHEAPRSYRFGCLRRSMIWFTTSFISAKIPSNFSE
jgi:hypothetical protein